MSFIQQHQLPPWSQLSFVLANDIIQRGLHTEFLTPTEIAYFEKESGSFSQWLAFINAVKDDANDDSTSTEYTVSERDLAAFRVRSMLFEQFVPHLYHSKRPCCQHSQLDFDRIVEKARQVPLEATADTTDSSDASRSKPSNLQPVTDAKKQESSPSDALLTNDDSESVAPVSNHPSGLHSTDNIPLRDVYNTLEYDYTAMKELQKLEEFEAQQEMNEDDEKERTEDYSLSILNTNNNFNLKYLLQGIAANRHQTTLTDRDIRNLLSDFKPHRTKWANDDKMGQEELYEACEKVLTDLKNYTEHSTPFLNKVSKREAPDYFDVIKRPMDFGTVTKKMKQLQYKSKKEFADDLYLIYENCLTYNTNPASEYRKHAIAMRRKTDRLMARVPDITIKERTEVEAEEFGDDASDDGDADSQRVSRKGPGKRKHPASSSSDTAGGVDRTRVLSRERSLTRESSAALSNAADAGHHGSDTESTDHVPNGHAAHKMYGGKQVKEGDSNADMDHDKQSTIELDTDLDQLQDQTWQYLTKKTRAKIAMNVEKQYQFPFGDREAIVRSAVDMERFAILEHMHWKPSTVQKLVRSTNDRFLRWTENNGVSNSLYDDVDLESSDDENLDAFFSRKISKPKTEEDDAMRTDLFLPEYNLSCGIPEIYGVNEELPEDDGPDTRSLARKGSTDTALEASASRSSSRGYTNVPLDVYSSVSFPNHGTNELIERNLRRIRQIRYLYAKCNAIRNDVPIATLAASIPLDDAASQPTMSLSSSQVVVNGEFPASHTSPEIPSVSRSQQRNPESLPPLIINAEAGEQLLKRVLAKLLAHAGFEGTHTNALNIMTELAMEYMLNIGKTLRCYWDDYGRQMRCEEILLHVMYENGVLDIDDLESYLRDDIERYGHRLDELHRKLEVSYQDLLSGPSDKLEDQDDVFKDDDAFLTGSFGQDLGDDYFGFKELGLDQEFNIDAFSIPARLWFGRNKETVKSAAAVDDQPKLAYPPPPPFSPVTSANGLIGLLQPIFQEKLANAPQGLIEDEYQPSRHRNKPRYPPTSKTSGGRKKALKDGGIGGSAGGSGGGSDSKKKKKKRPLEEINAEKAERAEKRRQKQEEKALKTAEREQKRKQREELKEQERLAKQEAKEKKALAKDTGGTASTPTNSV